MSTTGERTIQTRASGQERGTPRVAKPIVLGLSILLLVMVGAQFTLAAYGAFGGSFAEHAVLGRAMTVVAVLLLLAVIVARSGTRFIVMGVVLALLCGPAAIMLAGASDEGGSVVGALHGLNAVFVAALAGMMARAGRSSERV